MINGDHLLTHKPPLTDGQLARGLCQGPRNYYNRSFSSLPGVLGLVLVLVLVQVQLS